MNCLVLVLFVLLSQISSPSAKDSKDVVINDILELRDFKKLLRTRTNVLICFTNNLKQSARVIQNFKEAAQIVKGSGTMVLIDCTGDAKKLCKKLKVFPDPLVFKHYKDGEFNKDYDRKMAVKSFVNFMRDPTGDLPWEEDSTASSIVHLLDAASLKKFIKKESKPIMIMFYAPWCGYCKILKPDYAAAAAELQGHSVLAAIDVSRPENSIVTTQYNITGFPILLCFHKGVFKYRYEGDTNKNSLVSFMRNPDIRLTKVKETDWTDTDSEVVHLTTLSFDPVIKEESSVLVMFYAPWCSHCKRMKPEYERAAAIMKTEGIPGMLAALDSIKEQMIASRYSVKGYPTIKYFSYGEFKFDINVRDAPKIVEFMRNPREPPPPPPPEKPWSDEETAVVHLTEENFKPFLKKKKHVLVMFYVPWCGHCKRAKPEFSKAAEKYKEDPRVEFAAVDCTTQQALCSSNDIRGYPTIKYFSYYSKVTKHYSGARTETDFVQFMSNPESTTTAPPEQKEDWSTDSQSILHLTDDTFKKAIQSSEPVLVMFYAPWCGHCKRLKPDYVKAAEELKAEGFQGQMAMLDCTVNPQVSEEYKISGFPTLKLFKNGKFIGEYDGKRTPDDIKQFIKSRGKKKDEL